MNKNLLIRFFLILALLNCIAISKLFAYIEVKITNSNQAPMPLVVLDFIYDKKSKNIANSINNIITYDLKNSGTFSIFNTKPPTYIDNTYNITKTRELLSSYMDFNALVVGKVIYEEGYYKVSYIIWDIYNDKPLIAKIFNFKDLSQDDIIYLSHHISNSIYKVFIGENGYFNSKIAFVSNNKVYLMDYDGNNKHVLIDSKTDTYTPIFSSNNKYLAYITLTGGVSEIFIYDFNSKINCKLGNFNNLVLAPRFSNDDKFLLFAIAKKGSTNIFKLNIETKEVKQLTYSDSINIPGGFSPNDNYIVFNSDRMGVPQIYIMSSDGCGIKRISSLKGAYYTPKWSNRGDLIAFTKIMKGGKFNIGVIDSKGENERIIVDDYFAEGPSWSSNGRALIYQYVYDIVNKYYGFALVNLSNGHKLLLSPFNNAKDPSLSSNSMNLKILEAEYNLM